LFPALVCALFDKKSTAAGALAGLVVASFLRFGGGDATLGLPIFLPYPILDAAEELVNGERVTILFPFRTLAMVCGLITNLLVARLTQQWTPPQPLVKVEA
jgi:high affinity choline transporter 7